MTIDSECTNILLHECRCGCEECESIRTAALAAKAAYATASANCNASLARSLNNYEQLLARCRGCEGSNTAQIVKSKNSKKRTGRHRPVSGNAQSVRDLGGRLRRHQQSGSRSIMLVSTAKTCGELLALVLRLCDSLNVPFVNLLAEFQSSRINRQTSIAPASGPHPKQLFLFQILVPPSTRAKRTRVRQHLLSQPTL